MVSFSWPPVRVRPETPCAVAGHRSHVMQERKCVQPGLRIGVFPFALVVLTVLQDESGNELRGVVVNGDGAFGLDRDGDLDVPTL